MKAAQYGHDDLTDFRVHIEVCQVLISAGVDANDEGACRQRYLMFAPDTYTFCVPYIPFTSPLFAVASLH